MFFGLHIESRSKQKQLLLGPDSLESSSNSCHGLEALWFDTVIPIYCSDDLNTYFSSFTDKSHLPVWVHVSAPGFRQLHSTGPEVLQPEHHGLHRVEEQHRPTRLPILCHRGAAPGRADLRYVHSSSRPIPNTSNNFQSIRSRHIFQIKSEYFFNFI